ncbi:hypothetical protein HDU93_005531, partial [Gonapodya sp. JEL0774]
MSPSTQIQEGDSKNESRVEPGLPDASIPSFDFSSATATESNLEASTATLQSNDTKLKPEAETAIDMGPSAEAAVKDAQLGRDGKLTPEDEPRASSPKPKDETRRIALAVLALSLGMAVSTIDGTFVATMLPTISRDLNGADSYQWVGTGYLLTSTALAPVWGKLSDIFGRKELLMFCMIEFTVFSALCAVSNSMTMLIVSRLFQGIGGGALMALTFVVIGEIIAPRERGNQGAITGICAIIGPFLGGVITDHLSWRWGFWLNVPVGIIALIAYQIALKLPKPAGTFRSQLARVDTLGVLLITGAITLLLLAFTWGGVTYPWVSGQVLGTTAVALVVLPGFLWWETKSPEPVVPLELFKNLNYILTNVVLFFVGWAIYGMGYFLPIYFQTVRGLSPTDSGVMNIPLTAFLIISSIAVGVATMKTGIYVRFPQVGMALVAVAMGLFSMLDENSEKWLEIIPQVICGVGFGMTMSTGTLIAQTNAPDHMIGPSSTIANFTRSLGAVLGIAVFATILQNISGSHAASGLTTVAMQYKLSSSQIALFLASLQSEFSGVQVDLSSIPLDALQALRLVYRQATVAGLRFA